VQLASVPPADIKEGARHWGLIPRRVFRLLREGDETHAEAFARTIGEFNFEDIHAVSAAEAKRQLKYSLIHVIPNEQLKYVGLKFCSELAATQLSQAYYKKQRQQVADWLVSATKPEYAGLRGNLFEPFVHHELETPGEHKYKIRKLAEAASPAAPAAAAVAPAPSEKVFRVDSHVVASDLLDQKREKVSDPGASTNKYKVTYEVHLPKDLSLNCYVQPAEKIFPAVDSFLVSKDELSLFQVTVSRDHGVKAHYLNLLLGELKEVFKYHSIRLYFVTLPDVFPDLRAQPYYTTEGVVANNLNQFPHVKQVEQFALEFFVSSKS